MFQLQNYMLRQLLIATGFALLAVACVIWLTQSLRLMNLVVDHGAHLLLFLRLMLLILPTFLYMILPAAVVIGVMFIYHRLTYDSELVVMRAAGLSPWQLANPAIRLGFGAAALGLLITFVVAPWANRELVRLEYTIREDASALLLRDGQFNRLRDGLMVYIKDRAANGRLLGIIVHDERKPETPITIMAEQGEVVSGGPNNTARVVVYDGRRQEFNRANGRLAQLEFERYTVDLAMFDSALDTRWSEPRERSISHLLHPTAFDLQMPNIQNRFYGEIASRAALPLLALSFALLAVAIIVQTPFNRRGMLSRLIIVTIIVIGWQSAAMSLGSMISRNLWFIALLAFVVLSPAFYGLWRLRRR